MIVSSRAERRRMPAFVAILAIVMSTGILATGALAQQPTEVSRLAEEARQAFLSAEQGGSAKQKAEFYQVALARIQLIEKFAGSQSGGPSELRDGAKVELERLADDGLSRDMLGAMLIQSSLSEMTSSQSNADRVELGVTLHQLASEQKAPEYRAAAFIELAQAYARVGVQDRALRYVQLAVDAAKSILGAGEQSGAYNAAARLAVNLGSAGVALAERAIMQMPRARDRASARRDMAVTRLKGTPWQKAPTEQLASEARKRLSAGDLPGSLQVALALPSSNDQEKMLNDIIAASLKKQDRQSALAAAQGLFSPSDQQKALAVIVKDYVARGVPLQSVDIISGMQEGTAKITAQLTLASELERAGYGAMAGEVFSEALRSAEAGDQAMQAVIWPEVVRAMTRADRLDQAMTYIDRLQESSETSSALGDLAKRLADSERLADAQGLLPKIREREDRSHALSGIGRAKAQAGDAAGALQIVAEISEPEDAGRVQAAVVKSQSQAGKFTDATALAGNIADKEAQVEAWVEIGRQATRKKDVKTGENAYAEAIRIAESQDKTDRDKAFYVIVKSLADLGDKARADELRQRIIDDKIRTRADEALAKADAKQAVEQKKRSSLPDAILKRRLSRTMNDSDKEDIALEIAEQEDGIILAAELIRSIADDRIRVAAFRRLAEKQAASLSKPVEEATEVADTTASLPRADEAELGPEQRTRRGLVLAKAESEPAAPVKVPLPAHFAKAADIRGMVPWPGGADAGVTFANYNLYISKFLDEGPTGSTRIEQAVRYQGIPSPRLIVVQNGVTTLGMLARQLQGTPDQNMISVDGDVLTLRAPVFVAPGATLILSRLDVPTYRLSTEAGAFIASAGELHVVDADVIGYSERAGQPAWSDKSKTHIFRPFLLSWGDGRMNVASSVLVALGYENSKSFGLSYSSGPIRVSELRDQAHATGYVVDNVFRNSHFGFYSYEAESIHIIGNEYVDNVVYGLDPHDRTRKLTIAYNTTYGTMMKHGIIISREVDESWIVGNLAFDNVGSGIMLDRDSANNVVHANSSFQNMQDGITLFESSCNLMTSNQLLANKRDGLKIRNSFDIGIYGNRIERNGSAGVSAYVANLLDTKSGDTRDFKLDPYAPVTSASLRRNRFYANGVGINAQGASGLTLFSNRFVKQSRRLFGGDLRGLEGLVLQAASQTDTLVASTCRPARPVIACHLRDQGYFEGSADVHIFDPNASSDCTSTNDTVQHRAFSNTSQGT